ncbi:MAG: hypothetical protein Fur0025_32860 [Oscillatoriaceae cyanobacterium]
MNAQTFFPGTEIAEIFGKVWRNGGLTQNDRHYLRFTLLGEHLSDEERATIDRMLHAVRRGWLQIFD